MIPTYRGIQFSGDWVSKVIQQLNKDLLLTGFEQQFDCNSSAEQFVTACIRYFETLLIQNEPQLFNLLYRIDVPQEKIHNTQGTPHISITKEILNREFQKVVLKSQF
ncbi:MAG: hypothetical protein N4A35_16475 [Flavobacteriales bacterium]|jgi:hypothetical protein|nr:hypothetical protein [Flavobacteriales bacterium]